MRPRRLIVVAGTGTDVGKTWVSARLLERSAGTKAVRKPVQSFAAGAGPTDADVLAAATGETATDVCPAHRWYELPMAPFLAAARLGRPPFTLADLLAELRWPARVDLGLVEPAGGVRSPMTSDGADTVDLVAALRPDVVLLVADAGLGTINAVRLACGALGDRAVEVVLNRFDPGDEVHVDNLAWLRSNLGVPVRAGIDELPTGR